MKKPKTTTQKPVPKAEQSTKAVVTKATQKKPNKAVVTKATPNIPSKDKKSPKKAPTLVSKSVAVISEMTIPDRVGSTAGSIWHYLTENGATSVAKMLRELSEEEKIIQRSIGWLAQEGKITLDTSGRVETIALKE